MDETTPEVAGGICYVLVTGVVMSDEAFAKSALAAVPGSQRARPFHWATEGIRAKERMLEALETLDVLGRAVVVACGRSQQEAARAVALARSVNEVIDDACEHLIIESRSRRQDGRDRTVVLDVLNRRHAHDALTYEWRPKAEPLLWIPDAIAGGVREHLTAAQPEWFDRIRDRTGLQLDYRHLAK